MLKQLENRQSIINQGDVFIQKRNQKEALRLASFDTKRSIPEQIWYDSLRGSDDGSFTRVTATNTHNNIDPIDYQHSQRSKISSRKISVSNNT